MRTTNKQRFGGFGEPALPHIGRAGPPSRPGDKRRFAANPPCRKLARIPRRSVPWLVAAFSLIELLVVIAILGLLTVLVAGPFGSMLRSSEVARAGQLLADEIMQARQTATALNRDVELRMVELPGHGQPAWSAIQLWVADENGDMAPLGRLRVFPAQAVISPEAALSPLLTADARRGGTAAFGPHGQRPWRGFRMRAGGALDQGVIGPHNNFLTIVARIDSAAAQPPLPPDNFFAVRINPVTGRATIHRP